jgi:hypothetical protein
MCKLKITFDELRLFQWYCSRATECFNQPLFFLVLLGLVKRYLWDPLVCALRVPVRLPRLVWISYGCCSVVVWRSSQSLPGFGISLPDAWSHPTLAGIKLVIRCFTASYLCYPCKLSCSWPTIVKIRPSLYRQQFGTYHLGPKCLTGDRLQPSGLVWSGEDTLCWGRGDPFLSGKAP